jgi:NADH:ubiquinone oxidoreductase subunit F (NADH-binding)
MSAGQLPRLLAGVTADSMSLSRHLSVHGGLPELGRRDGPALIAELERAGLRGRGGAAFPTATKMAAVAEAGRASAVVVNGAEGEPASEKDALLMAGAPHLVLDGAELAARAVGARDVIVCIRSSADRALQRARRAIEERGRTKGVSFKLVATPDAYLAGEESALVRFLNGGPLKPTFVPPRPYERGVDRRPTLVNNVETLAHLALIARHGARWFREVGSPQEPGSTLVTLSGAVLRPGVYEVEPGARLSALLEAADHPTDEVRAVLIGGYFGAWVDGSRVDEIVLGREELRQLGGSLGSGVVFVLPARACGVAESARALAYMARESAHQCGPCANGLPAIAQAVARIAHGMAPNGMDADIERWAGLVHGRGACHHPNGAARLALSSLRVFADEFARHRTHGPCARCSGVPLLPVPGDSGRLAA